MHRFQLLIASHFALAVVFLGSAHAAPVPVTSCGQKVNGAGVLTGDLDCSAAAGPAVILGSNSRLNLAGFTVLGNEVGVQCAVASCTITGPGTIRRAALPAAQQPGILGLYSARVFGVVLENWPIAIEVLGATNVRGCTIRDSGIGVIGEQTRIADSSFSNDGIAVHGNAGTPSGPRFGQKYIFWGVHLLRSSFTGNGIDIASYKRPVVRDSTCTTSDVLHVVPDPFNGGDEWGVCS
jgi:hypothetical protein